MSDSDSDRKNSDHDGQSGPSPPQKTAQELKEDIKKEIQKRKQKNESNQQLQRFKKIMSKTDIGNSIISRQEKINAIPQNLEEDVDEAVLYSYFAIHYLDPHIFQVILTRTNRFEENFEYQQLLGKEKAYDQLSKETSYSKFRLNQIAFQIALEKDYYDIAEHFITAGSVHITWDMVRKMISRNQEYLVKRCIKFQTKFDPGSATIKKIVFAGRSAAPLEDRTIKLVDFIQIMLELKWKTREIINVLKKYSKKGKIDAYEIREMFLMFAMKRKIKLMSYMINSDEFHFDFQEANFIDIIENDAYDIGVLLYREYFLQIKKDLDKIINLLINSFSKSNGMLEAKCFLLKRFMNKMSFEQAIKFLEIIEQRIFDSSKGNLLILTLNVVKASCLLIELLEKVKGHFGFMNRRIFEIRSKITKICSDFMKDVQSEEEMRFYLLEKDFDERDALTNIYDFEIMDLLEHPFARNIVQQIWTSQYNNSHSLFTVSTAHTLLFNFNHCRNDEEENLRFYKPRDTVKLGCHPFQFQVWRYSGSSRHIVETITCAIFAIVMHILITRHMTFADFLLNNKEQIQITYKMSQGIDPLTNNTISSDQIALNDALYSMWNNRIQNFEQEAMNLTYLMELAWFYFFQHIFNAIFATKNKRVMHFVNVENFLDFMVFAVGWSYVSIIYKSYRLNTFLQYTTPFSQATLYWENYVGAYRTNESIVLLVYQLVLWCKVFIKLKLISVSGPLFAVLTKLLYDMFIFALFYFAELFLFAIVGIVLFSDLEPFQQLSSALFVLFKATIQDYDVNMMDNAKIGNFFSYCYFIAFLLLNLVLVVNIIVGLQSYAYKNYSKKRDILMLLSTLSVREVTEADDKYSSVISAPFPLSVLNFVFGGIIIGMKSETANICLLALYFIPIALLCFFFFFFYTFLIIPFCYVKLVGHKFALMIKSPKGQGVRGTLDRGFKALFFLALGLPILAVDSIVDLFWFLRHMFTMKLDKSHLQVMQTTNLHKRTYKKMFKYFEQKNEQLVPQKRVAEDLRTYLDVMEGIRCMVYGKPKEVPFDKTGLYIAYAKKILNQNGRENPQEQADPSSKYEVEQVAQEFQVVKQVLLNNSFSVNMQEIQQNTVKQKGWGKKILFDKKTFYNLLVDLQRMRKVLNLKKCFFVFHILYEGKPKEMNAWHKKVEQRVTKTLQFLNTSRLLKIIGYDPAQHIKLENINFKKSNSLVQRKQQIDEIPLDMSQENNNQMLRIKRPAKNDAVNYERVENLNQNMEFMMNKYANASNQIKELTSILRKLNINNNVSYKPLPQQEIEFSNLNKINQSNSNAKKNASYFQKQSGAKLGIEEEDDYGIIQKIRKESKKGKDQQHQVNYISPSKVGVIIKPDTSQKNQNLNTNIKENSEDNQSEAVLSDDDTGVHKESEVNEIQVKRKK